MRRDRPRRSAGRPVEGALLARRSDRPEILLPPFALYDCVMCGWCCGQYDITVSEQDHKRLARNDWGEMIPDLAGVEWGRPTGKREPEDTWRLATRPDGRCVFLSKRGVCLMHAQVTEMGKALACATFPFSIADTPSGVYVGLRFSCKSVAEGTGRTLESRRPFLERLVRRLEREGHSPVYRDPIRFDGARTLGWSDYLKLEDTLIAALLRAELPMTHRVAMAWRLVTLVREWDLENMRRGEFWPRLQALNADLTEQYRGLELTRPELKPRERVLFRQFLNLFHRRAAPSYFAQSLGKRLRERLRWFVDGIRFAMGRGRVRLREAAGPVALRKAASVRLGPLDPKQERMLSRFMACKIFGKQIFGRLFFGYSFFDGFAFLTCAYASVLWYARAFALARGAGEVSTEDLSWAIRTVDFSYNYSEAPSRKVERLRVRTLARDDTAVRLAVAWGEGCVAEER